MKVYIKLLPDQSPGNTLALTVAIRDLKAAHPDLQIGVGGGVEREFLAHNPHIDPCVTVNNADQVITAQYPFNGSSLFHYAHAYTEDIGRRLGFRIPHGERRPEVFFSSSELIRPKQMERPYWILNAGYRTNISAKYWGYSHFCELVELLKNEVNFVQIGGLKCDTVNPSVPGAVDLRGKTAIRELMLLMRHADGVVTPVSMPMHLAAALYRPCVVIAGGREAPGWTAYDSHQYLHTVGCLSCCRLKGCHKRRVVPLGDGKKFDASLCSAPVNCGEDVIPLCMSRISPRMVAEAVRLCL